ncbi:cellular morphogenesis regulator dopa [Phyllosticta citriasiana]|uniref:Cellular morphogenesis regulator dopa n=1 Tax=Phyllosticta citriasiana TaxID=595635 RepID=A0ABR1KR18_9PEZI
MSLDPIHRSASPASSGRASPIRSPRRRIEDGSFKKDKAFRRYESNVERALALFDTPQQEWADYISFLGRLLKAIQTHPPDLSAIPHSGTVATRLAQCLNPSLPSGVHQKALEVYTYIFSVLKTPALSRDLQIYFPGLASVLTFASLSVRPAFLSLIEAHILAVDPQALRPALKSIILCFLPGLEEETAEDFERVVQMMDNLRFAVSGTQDRKNDGAGDAQDSYFWQCFFLATITNAPRRQGALAYLVRRLPKFGSRTPRKGSTAGQEDGDGNENEPLSLAAEAVIAPEPGLLIRCFAAGLGDSQLLTQRGYLDLLVNSLPLHSEVLQIRIDSQDLERLVTAAAGVVARRDMSLNRRLWSWLLGPEPAADERPETPADSKGPLLDLNSHHAAYFARYGLPSLTSGILAMINSRDQTPVARARPFRVCLSLMDRWEVGGLLVPALFLPALESARVYGETADREAFEDVFRSASIFFDGVESGLIWGKILELLDEAMSANPQPREEQLRKLKLAKFIITRFNVREEEMLLHHIPLLTFVVLNLVNRGSQQDAQNELEKHINSTKLEIADLLVQLVPDRVFASGQGVKTRNALSVDAIRTFYDRSQGNIEASGPLFTGTQLKESLLREACTNFINSLRDIVPGKVETSTKILSNILSKMKDPGDHDRDQLLSAFHACVDGQPNASEIPVPFPAILAITTVMAAFQASCRPHNYFPQEQLPDLVSQLVRATWFYLSPFRPKYHVEAVRCLWQLQAMTASDHLVEAAITSLMLQDRAEDNATLSSDAGRRFAVLWAHTIHELNLQAEKSGRGLSRRPSGLPALSGLNTLEGGYQAILTRPLLLLLDALTEEGTELFFFVRAWLQDLPSLNRVLDIIILHLHSLNCFKYQASEKLQPSSQKPAVVVDDSKECLYYMQHLLNILRWSSDFTWMVLARDVVPMHDPAAGQEKEVPLQILLVQTSMRTLSVTAGLQQKPLHVEGLYRTAISILRLILMNPYSLPLRELELENFLMDRLAAGSPPLQSLLLDATLAALRLRLRAVPTSPSEDRSMSRQRQDSIRESVEKQEFEAPHAPAIVPPTQLVECLKTGFSSSESRLVLDDWVKFLIEVLPLFADTIFQNLLPMSECLAKQIQATFDQLKSTFHDSTSFGPTAPESTLISLMNGLEQILASAHDRLMLHEVRTTAAKTPEQPQGFFGNMVSGVFSPEHPQARSATANSRLTVLLCFQDTVRICFNIWSWGGYGLEVSKQDTTSIASFSYTSLRMRNRARRILEHLFAAEALECLETLTVIWCRSPRGSPEATAVLSLLNVLNGSSPKHTTPTIFNALYSRTNPNALDPHRMSTLTSNLADTDLVAFLVDYTKSLEDDAMDEIWPDCFTFLRDVLTNPMPHRQILPGLLEFTATLAEKVDNTNFGEQRRMRRDLGDLFTRLLTATFTTRPLGYLSDPSSVSVDKVPEETANGNSRSSDLVTILANILPKLSLVLVEPDRIASAATAISTNVIGPTVRAKVFPENVSPALLDLFYQITRVVQGSKAWKKDIADAFNDARFFSSDPALARDRWLPVLRQWTVAEKDRMPELLSRLSAPTTAGIMFGVGATSARQEADRRTQLNLRRVCALVMANQGDTFVGNVSALGEKLVELFTATPASSPSSATRAEAFLLLRSLILRLSPTQLAPLWPIVTSELTAALSSLFPDNNSLTTNHDKPETYNNMSILHACKLLDTLVTINHDDFQLHEWLYLTDTIDAVYRPDGDWTPVALVDELAESLQQVAAHASASARPDVEHAGSGGVTSSLSPQPVDTVALPSSASGAAATATSAAAVEADERKRVSFLNPVLAAAREQGVWGDLADIKAMPKTEFVMRVVRPFLGQLSIAAFEETYKGGRVDWDAVERDVVADLWEVGGVV